MDNLNWVLGVSIISMGIILVPISLPLALGKVGPNSAYGIRFSLSYKSDDHWYAINRNGGRQMVVWGTVLVFLGIAGLFIPSKDPSMLLGGILGTTSLIFIPVIQAWRFAKRFDAQWEKERL